MAATTGYKRRIFSLDGLPAVLEVESSATVTSDAPFNPPFISHLSAAHRSQSEKTIVVFCSEDDHSTPSTVVNSRAPSPVKEREDINYDEETKPIDRLLLWRLASGFFSYFVIGWAEGVTGTVMPYLSAEFKLTSTLSSSLFAGYTCGFFIGTFCVEWILSVLGRSRAREVQGGRRNPASSDAAFHSASKARYLLLLIASVVHALYFVLMGSRTGFSVMFAAYAMSALARSLLSAPLNAYFATGPKQAFGYGMGLSTLGSVISPLVCQSVIASGVPWHRFYYGSLVLSGLNLIFLAKTYKPTALERQIEHHEALKKSRLSSISSSYETTPVEPTKRKTLRMALKMPYQWAISCFILLYCGSEGVTQGFMVSYLLAVKGANPRSIGYVTSGFWAGSCVGRFIWGYLSALMTFTQRKHAIHFCVCAAVVFQVLVWVIGSPVLDAVAASFVGLFYGPIFPACLAMANDILPAVVHMVAMALISSFASLGGAIFPLMMGAILDAKGMKSFTLITVPLAAAMAFSWNFFPNRVPSSRISQPCA